ncbi:MAG: hypothetical protein JO244_08500, partial [Solirubrobacterales bacterium]|nr:hypothetical protein [Solirubrobacterales bacterium]
LLYELLTGTTPVDKKSLAKASLLEIVRIVQEVEAPRPSSRLSTIDTLPSVAANRGTEPAKLSRLMKGELDWLVLRALEKDRTRRYDTANALSRDIQRYLADEVVEARPPSAGYRLKKFVRRHRGQVIAVSLVLLALVAGIVGTTLGLFEARRHEQIARDETAEKEKANNELAQASDKLLNDGARGLLRTLVVQVQPNKPVLPLNNLEIDALWELAAAMDERLRLRFVELALNDPGWRRRLRDRAPFAFQAAVGLDGPRRTRVEELLGKRLAAREISPEEQEDVALCLAHLGNLDRRLAGKTAATLTQAMSRTTEWRVSEQLARGLLAVSGRLEPKEAAEFAATLVRGMSTTTRPQLLPPMAEGLLALLARLEPKEASELCGQAAATLIQDFSKTTDPNLIRKQAPGLSAVLTRLEPKDAAKVAATLTQAMSQTTNPVVREVLAQGLSAAAARLEPK